MRSIVLRSDTIRAKAQLCPIDTCPDEILLIIFEEAVRIDEDDRFKEATILSHVCKRWRALALRISSLWSQIVVSMAIDDLKGLQEFLDRTRLRLGSKPITITIEDIHKHETLWDSFVECLDLNRFPHIAELILWFWAYRSFPELFHDRFRYSSGPIDRLLIAGETETRIHVEDKQDCSCIFRNFPTARRVTFQDLDSLAVGGKDIFPSVLELSFYDVEIDILSQLYRFPNLTTFTITGTQRDICVDWVTQEITLPSLVEMEVISVIGFHWDQIRAPRLQRLEFADELAEVVRFIRRHESLKHIDCGTWLKCYEIEALSDAAGEAEVLAVFGDIDAFFSTGNPLPFPSVTYLTLYLGDGVSLSLEGFENLVRSRCLQSDVQHGIPSGKRIEMLELDGLVEYMYEQPWRKSSLLIHFDESLARSPDPNSTFGILSLKLKSL